MQSILYNALCSCLTEHYSAHARVRSSSSNASIGDLNICSGYVGNIFLAGMYKSD